MRVAIVESGIVTDVIMADQSFITEQGLFGVESEDADIGWVYDGTAVAPPPIDPATILTDWRAAVSIRREDFAVAALEAGLATETEAEQWGAGNALPVWVQEAINMAKNADGADVFPTASEKMRARLSALREPRVRRASAIIEILRATKKLTEDQVDVLFGGSPE